MAKKKNQTLIVLGDTPKKAARMGAARLGISLSEYIEGLVVEDSARSGIAKLVQADDLESEVRDDG